MRDDDLLHAHLPGILRLAAQYGVRNIREAWGEPDKAAAWRARLPETNSE